MGTEPGAWRSTPAPGPRSTCSTAPDPDCSRLIARPASAVCGCRGCFRVPLARRASSLIRIVAALAIVGFSVSVALANPALLPKHEGYPAKASTSPVTGQPTANDAGQTNGGGEKALTKSVDASDNHVQQKLVDQNNNRIKEKHGAGQLPSVQG